MGTSVAELNVKLTASSADMAGGLKVGGDALSEVRVQADGAAEAIAGSSVAIDKSLASARKAAATWNDESTVLKRLGKEHDNLIEKLNETKFDVANVSLIENAKGTYSKEIAAATVDFRNAENDAQKEFEATLARLQGSIGTAPTAAATARFDQASAAARDIRDTKVAGARDTYKARKDSAQGDAIAESRQARSRRLGGDASEGRSAGNAHGEGPENPGVLTSVAESLELLKKGVQFKAAKILGETLHGLAEGIREVSEASRTGASIGEIVDHLAAANPVVGPWWEAGKAIREAITGEQVYIDEMKELEAEMKRAQATTAELRKSADEAKVAVGKIQFERSGRAYVDGQTTTYGKAKATADVDYSRAAREAAAEYETAVKAANDKLGDSHDQLAINAHGAAIAAAGNLRDTKIADAADKRDHAKTDAGNQEQAGWQSSIDGMVNEQKTLRGELVGETAEYAKMHAEVDAMTSATAEQKQAAIDRWKAEDATTKTLRDQLAAKKAFSDAVDAIRIESNNIGKTETEIKGDAFARQPGVDAYQAQGYRSALKSLDDKKLGQALKDSLKTPVDDAKKQLADIQTVATSGTITGDEAATLRARVADGLKTLADGRQSGGPPADSLIVAGSDASRNYVDTLARSSEHDLTKDQLDIAKQARDLLKTIAGNAPKQVQVVTLSR